VPGIEPGPPDLWLRTLTTRTQRRSMVSIENLKIYTNNKIPYYIYELQEQFERLEREIIQAYQAPLIDSVNNI
jgi:hypothetical protein